MKNSSNAFFVCFTMRNPNNQTIASPAPHHNSSFSASLSRRLLSLNSSSSRRKSSSSETAEPSSPKVTCIGQVKIKSKKKRTSNNSQHLVNRSRSGRETNSFRRREVKAISICDALSCFMPALCGSWKSCYRDSNGGSKKEQRKCGGDRKRKRYSWAVFIRWLMAADEEEVEDKKVRNLNDFNEIGRFVREREEEDDLEYAFSRKKEEDIKEEEEEEEEEVQVNVCIPPKNALLLMRCRSDPVRMAALSTKFWDSPAMKVDCKNEEDVEVKEAHFVEEKVEKIEEDKNVVAEDEVVETKVLEKITENNSVDVAGKVLKEEELREEGEIVLRRSISCSTSNSIELSKLKEGEERRSFSYREKEKRRHSFSVEKELTRRSFCSEKEARRSSFSSNNSKESKKRWSFSFEKENLGLHDKPLTLQPEAKTEETPPLKEDFVKSVDQPNIESCKGEETQTVEKEKKPRELPKCLLLMMYEPKLSMEVSKETWICNTDFVHQRRTQHPKPKPECIEEEEENMKVEYKHAENKNKTAIVHQTPSEQQSLISPMEEKLLKSLAVSALPQAHHLVLTRCKSEPGKSSARLMADPCFWKARHQPIGTASIGF